MDWMVQLISAFMAIFFFSILVEVPKKYLWVCGVVAAFGWLGYLVVGEITVGVFWENFVSAAIMAFLSHIFARVLKQPVTMFFVAGILTIVPGGMIYRMAYYFIKGSMDLGIVYLLQTIEIAGAIALAIFIMDTIFGFLKTKKRAA